METYKELNLKCRCSNEILHLEKIEDETYWCIYYLSPISYNFLRRLKFLFTGRLSAGEIILADADMLKINKFIEDNANI